MYMGHMAQTSNETRMILGKGERMLYRVRATWYERTSSVTGAGAGFRFRWSPSPHVRPSPHGPHGQDVQRQ